MNLFNIFMAKKKVVEGDVVEGTPVCTVSDQNGVEVQTFGNVTEAYAFASENGYQVSVTA
jgi:uncharacterized protein YhfF